MELAEARVHGVEDLLAQIGKIALQDQVDDELVELGQFGDAVGVRAAPGVELEVVPDRRADDFRFGYTQANSDLGNLLGHVLGKLDRMDDHQDLLKQEGGGVFARQKQVIKG